jgi:hypothetical protein
MRSQIQKRTSPSASKPPMIRPPPVRSMNAQIGNVSPLQQQQLLTLQQQRQQQQPQRIVGQPSPQNIPKYMQQSQQAQQQQQQTPSSLQSSKMDSPKISIGNAIALTSLRLGKIEEYIMKLQEEGIEDILTNGGGIGSTMSGVGEDGLPVQKLNENIMMIEKAVWENITKRLDSLEKQNREFSASIKTHSMELQNQKKQHITIINVQNQMNQIQGSMAEFKKHMEDTNTYLQEFETAISTLENNILQKQEVNYEYDANTLLDTGIDQLNTFNGLNPPNLYDNSLHDMNTFTESNPILDGIPMNEPVDNDTTKVNV